MIHGCGSCTPGDHTEPPTAGCSAGYLIYLTFRCIIISEENRKKIRVGDTLVVENFDPLTENTFNLNSPYEVSE